VTGVQTCALPIFAELRVRAAELVAGVGLRGGAVDLSREQGEALLAAQPLRGESQLERERLVEPDDLGSRRRVGPPGARQRRDGRGVGLVERRDGRGEALHRPSLPSGARDGTEDLTAPARGSRLATPL